MSTTRRLPDAQERKWLRERLPITEIIDRSIKAGRRPAAKGTIQRWYRELGTHQRPVTPAPKVLTPDRLAAILARVGKDGQGASNMDLVAEFGGSFTTYNTLRKRHGIPAYDLAAARRRASLKTPTGTASVAAAGAPDRLERLRRRLIAQTKPASLLELADYLDCGPATVERLAAELRAGGMEVTLANGHAAIRAKPEPGRLDALLASLYGQRVTLGLIGDTHIGSRHQQLTALRLFYREAKRLKVQRVIHHGDVFTGQGMWKDQIYENFRLGADDQEEYGAEVYPDDLPTDFIDGNHDWSHVKAAGRNIVRGLCKRRPDQFTYVGSHEATFPLTEHAKYMAIHPDGGAPYARSYRIQKLIESQQKATPKPVIVGSGHLHYQLYFTYLGIHGFHVGCFEAQSTYMKRKALAPDIGGWIVTLTFSDAGKLTKVEPLWLEYECLEGDYPQEARVFQKGSRS